MRILIYFVVIFMLIGPVARGAEVLGVSNNREIMVSQDPEKPWAVGDTVCTMHNKKEMQCGEVVRTTDQGAVIRLSVASKGVSLLPSPGDRVKRAEAKRSAVTTRKPAPAPYVYPKITPKNSPPSVGAANVPSGQRKPAQAIQTTTATLREAQKTVWLTLSPLLVMRKLSATDTSTGGTATFDSKMGFGAELRAALTAGKGQWWFAAVYEKATITPPTGRTFTTSEASVVRANIGYRYRFSSRAPHWIGLSAGIAQEILVEADTPLSLTVSKVSLPTSRLAVGTDIIRMRAFTVDADLGVDVYLSGKTASNTVQTGLGFSGQVTGRLQSGALTYSLGSSVSQQTMSASLLKQTTLRILAVLSLGLGF